MFIVQLTKVIFFILLSATALAQGDASPQPIAQEAENFGVLQLGNASIQLANRPIDIEVVANKIEWIPASSNDKKFSAYINQGLAFLHVFHYIDALRSFKMAQQIQPDSAYAAAGQIFSYLSLDAQASAPFVMALLEQVKPVVSSADLPGQNRSTFCVKVCPLTGGKNGEKALHPRRNYSTFTHS